MSGFHRKWRLCVVESCDSLIFNEKKKGMGGGDNIIWYIRQQMCSLNPTNYSAMVTLVLYSVVQKNKWHPISILSLIKFTIDPLNPITCWSLKQDRNFRSCRPISLGQTTTLISQLSLSTYYAWNFKLLPDSSMLEFNVESICFS